MAEGWPPGYQMQGSFQQVPQKPKVGFGVVCRCPGRSVYVHVHSQSVHFHNVHSV